MKKQLLFILLFVFSLLVQTPVWAISVANVQRKVADAERSHQRKSTGQKKSVPAKQTAAPKTAVNEWYGLPIISWKEFERANEQIKQHNEEFFKLDKQVQALISAKPLQDVMSFKQGLPNYAELVQNVHYIYIGEIHDEPAVEQEVKNLLAAIRQANPDKKILLATEFAQVFHPLINPLHRAEKPTSFLSDDYGWIEEVIKSLSMDMLALDDQIIQFPKDSDDFFTNPLIKVGDKYVRYDGKAISLDNVRLNYAREIYEASQQMLSSNESLASHLTSTITSPNEFRETYAFYKKEAPEWLAKIEKELDPGNGLWVSTATGIFSQIKDTELLPSWVVEFVPYSLAISKVRDMLHYSAWGINQRNNQWAERIKNVESNYDIVIIWAGEGHHDTDYPDALPYLIASSDATMFDFVVINSQMENETELSYAKRRTDLDNTPAKFEFPEEMKKELLNLEIDFEQTYHTESKDISYDKEIANKMAQVMGKEQIPNLPSRMITVFLE